MAKVVEVFDVPVKHPASRMWKALVEDAHVTLVTAVPGIYQSIDLKEGATWATPGNLAYVKFGKNMGDFHGFNFVKNKCEHADRNTREATWSIVEGCGLGTHWRNFHHTIKITGAADHAGSCVVHHTLQFESIGDHSLLEVYKRKAIETTHGIAAFLDANPNFGCVGN